jgi:hypothetical protein
MTDTTTGRPVLEIVLDGNTAYHQAEAALAHLDTHTPDPTRGETVDALVSEVVAAALAGEPIPENLGQRTAEAARIEPVIIQQARMQLRGRLETSRRSGVHDAITRLRELFDDLIAEARQIVPALDGARTAEDVEKKGPEAAAAWARLAALARRHNEIRSVQTQLVHQVHSSDFELAKYVPDAHGLVPVKLVFDVAGWLSNYDEMYPHWRERIRYGQRAVGLSAPPWPHSETSPERPNFADPAALLWLVTGAGNPWLPSIRDAAAVYVAATAAESIRTQEASEIRTHGRPLDSEERKRAREAAERRHREAEQQIDTHRRRAMFTAYSG